MIHLNPSHTTIHLKYARFTCPYQIPLAPELLFPRGLPTAAECAGCVSSLRRTEDAYVPSQPAEFRWGRAVEEEFFSTVQTSCPTGKLRTTQPVPDVPLPKGQSETPC